MAKLMLIAVGGAIGAVLRYTLAGWGQRLTQGTFPLGTLVVNVLGCLAIGMFAAAFAEKIQIKEAYRLAILVGLLGGFTTFSTYAFETMALLNDGQRWLALGNALLSNVLGLTAAWIGYRLVEQLYGV
jgi:CrcB protein